MGVSLLGAARIWWGLVGLSYFYEDDPALYGRELRGVGGEDAPAAYYLSTKLGGRPQPFDLRDAGALRRSVEESLRFVLTNPAIHITLMDALDRRSRNQRHPVIALVAHVSRLFEHNTCTSSPRSLGHTHVDTARAAR
jgi:hypothetical protein